MPRRKNNHSKESADRFYWTDATETAIIQYNNTDDNDEREHIFRTFIAKPLDKMAENIINRFKFPYINQSFDETKKQVVSFLVINLAKYTQEKGKSFAYFSVIAKNYLILHNNYGYKQEKRSLSLSDTNDTFVPIEEMVSLEAPDDRAQDDIKEFIRLMILYWDRNLTLIFKKKRDIDIANAVVELFRRAENIENFNKKALYLMIREMADCKTNYITKVVNKMRDITARQLIEYHQHGVIDRQESEMFIYDDGDD